MKIKYFCDPFGGMFDTPEDEWNNFNKLLKLADLPASEFVAVEEVSTIWNGDFDALVFDYGGMQMGNSLLEHHARYLVKCADDYPNKMFLINSTMSRWAIEEAVETIGKEFHNIFFEEEEFFDAIKQLMKKLDMQYHPLFGWMRQLNDEELEVYRKILNKDGKEIIDDDN